MPAAAPVKVPVRVYLQVGAGPAHLLAERELKDRASAVAEVAEVLRAVAAGMEDAVEMHQIGAQVMAEFEGR